LLAKSTNDAHPTSRHRGRYSIAEAAANTSPTTTQEHTSIKIRKKKEERRNKKEEIRNTK